LGSLDSFLLQKAKGLWGKIVTGRVWEITTTTAGRALCPRALPA